METIFRLYSNVGDNKSVDIVDAVMRNDCIYVIKYFESDKDISIIDSKGENLLHKAARNNNYEIVDLLVRFGVDVNAKNRYLDTPLHLAVQFKNSDVVEKLIFEKAQVNVPNKKKVYPLHIAATNGKEQIINILLDHGAKINASDENGLKPIHYAVKSGKKDVIRSLLNKGASLVECDDRKNNVLHHACEKGNDDLVIYILRHMMINNTKNIYGDTALHLASTNCSVKALVALIESGYDLDIKNGNGQTAYDIAKLNGKEENANYLFEMKRGTYYRDKYKKYVLHKAVVNKDYAYLIQNLKSVNVNDYDYFGKSLMYYAIINESLKIVELLYSKGARIDLIDEYNQSALLISVYTENVDIIKYLLDKKADVNEIFYGRSYLYRAILRNNYKIAELLLKYGADVNYVDSKHRTIYSYAIEYSDDEIISLLLDYKASLI